MADLTMLVYIAVVIHKYNQHGTISFKPLLNSTRNAVIYIIPKF